MSLPLTTSQPNRGKAGLAVLGVTFGAILQLYAQGYIVPNGVVYVDNSPSLINEIDVIQNPTNSDYTGFIFTPQSANTFSFGVIADEGVRVFFVVPNDPISLQPIQSQNYAELSLGNSYVFANGNSFYVGLYTGYTPQGGIYSTPLFGWAELANINGSIQLLNSSIEYGGGGIYAGTQTIIPVPEPGTFSLAALGALLIALRRWKK